MGEYDSRFNCFKSLTVRKILIDLDKEFVELEKKANTNVESIRSIEKIKKALYGNPGSDDEHGGSNQ